jgi:hypothetical protein
MKNAVDFLERKKILEPGFTEWIITWPDTGRTEDFVLLMEEYAAIYRKSLAERTTSNARLLKQLKETTDVLEKCVSTCEFTMGRLAYKKMSIKELTSLTHEMNEAIQKSKELTNLSE